MAEAHPNPFVHHLRHLLGSVPAAALADGQLLERFLAHRDETAVEVLVRRYGPLVLGVCRRVLHNSHAAEDAFQATFLVLVRKAPSLDRGKPLGSWLYTVAYRLALRARANELRRQRCEQQAARRRPPAGGRDPGPSDLVVALEEELHRLPERHRAALVLCYLEGKTNEQAAEILGCPRGSMAARLAQARERLRQGLARRGFAAPAAGLAAALATAAAPAAVPLPLLDNTARAALWFARGEAGATPLVSARAVELARGACRALVLNRLKIAGALLLVAALLGTGATMLLPAAPQPGPPAPADDPPPPEARPQRAGTPDRAANAAVPYGQAFLALRRGARPVGEKKLVAECLTLPLDADAREVVTRAGYALRMLRRGAALPRCDWAIDPEQGIDMPSSRGEAARVLAALACLRARLRFEEGQNAEALDDLVAALTLARHVGRDHTLDSFWAGYEIEQRLGEALALYLPRLDAPTVKDLRTRLDSLPPGGSVATATLRMEEAMLSWIAGEVQEAKDGESLLDFLSQLGTGPNQPEKRRAEGRALLADCGGTAAGVLRFTEEMRRHAAPLAQTLDLPPDQVDRELRREEKKLAGNPVFKVFAPVVHKVRVRQARADVRRALLAAALAVRLDGPAALKEHPDPVAGGPFERIAREGGFELRSRCRPDEEWHVPPEPPDDEPLTLRVGRPGG
jgi:RNA polymerase sigma factor (sigma-70 family)